MFAVKSTYSIKTPDGKDIPFYVANSEIFLCYDDLIRAYVKTSYIDVDLTKGFDNYGSKVFISLTDFKDATFLFASNWGHSAFWREIVNQDYSKVIAEVRDAQHFVKEYFRLDLPEEWHRLNVDAVIANLPVKATEWIEKCHNSLRILATNDEQRKDARRVYDEAWKILKAREKADNKYTALHEVLAKFGLAVDDLINATLDAHKAKFDKQHIYLESELRRILK